VKEEEEVKAEVDISLPLVYRYRRCGDQAENSA